MIRKRIKVRIKVKVKAKANGERNRMFHMIIIKTHYGLSQQKIVNGIS